MDFLCIVTIHFYSSFKNYNLLPACSGEHTHRTVQQLPTEGGWQEFSYGLLP